MICSEGELRLGTEKLGQICECCISAKPCLHVMWSVLCRSIDFHPNGPSKRSASLTLVVHAEVQAVTTTTVL